MAVLWCTSFLKYSYDPGSKCLFEGPSLIQKFKSTSTENQSLVCYHVETGNTSTQLCYRLQNTITTKKKKKRKRKRLSLCPLHPLSSQIKCSFPLFKSLPTLGLNAEKVYSQQHFTLRHSFAEFSLHIQV